MDNKEKLLKLKENNEFVSALSKVETKEDCAELLRRYDINIDSNLLKIKKQGDAKLDEKELEEITGGWSFCFDLIGIGWS